MDNGRSKNEWSGTSDPSPARELFLAALEYEGAERERFLQGECGGDEVLRRRIESLIEELESQGDYLESPAIARQSPAVGEREAAGAEENSWERPGDRIGRYKLLQKIGAGGSGVVFMAEQETPVRRRVALKVIKLGMDTKEVIARFEAERQALAMMEHPNIARVFDAGSTDNGRPYFVMELVRGAPITDYANENQLTTRERLELFIQVCQAIQHAHQKGVIHRDIKPSNILVTLSHGAPTPKVIDFGIAKAIESKLTDKTLFTRFHTFIGTPAYMSPEQAQMSSMDIDTRSDIYSLGVLLYEVLTGKTPFDPERLISQGVDECRREIREVEPVRPSQRLSTMGERELTTTATRRRVDGPRLIHQVRGDLDWIVIRCLEKDPSRRYGAASELVTDIWRHLNSEPIVARPPSARYRLTKFIRKHRMPVAAVTAVALSLAIGTGVSVRLALRATAAEESARATAANEIRLRKRAEEDKAAARLNHYIADINLAQQSLKDGNLGRAVRLLERHIPKGDESDLRGFEWRYLTELSQGDPHQDLLMQSESARALTFMDSGEEVAVSDGGRVNVVALEDQFISATLAPKPVVESRDEAPPSRFAFPSVESLAAVDGGRILVSASSSVARLWRTADWTEVRELGQATAPMAVSRDGTALATEIRDSKWGRNDGGVTIWDTSTWRPIRSLPDVSGPMAFSWDHRRLATDSAEGVRVWSIADGEESSVLLEDSAGLFGRVPGHVSDRPLAFSPDGEWVVAARNQISEHGIYVLEIWDATSGVSVGALPNSPEQVEHTGVISCVAFSPDQRMLATASMDHSIRLWDFETRKLVDTLYGHLNEIWTLAFSPDGKLIASGDKDGRVKIWKTEPMEPEPPLPGITHPIGFSEDGGALAALNAEDSLVFVNLASGESVRRIPLQTFRGHAAPFALSGHLNVLAQGRRDGGIEIRELDSGASYVLDGLEREVHTLVLSPNGRSLVAFGHGHGPWWFDLRAGRSTFWDIDADSARFSPNGAFVVTYDRDNLAQVWTAPGRERIATLEKDDLGSGWWGPASAISSDGQYIAIALDDHSVGLWDAENGALLGKFEGHKQPVIALAFSPDSKALATSGSDSAVRFWNVATRKELIVERLLGGIVDPMVFSPNGELLVGGVEFGSETGAVRFFRAPESESDRTTDNLF